MSFRVPFFQMFFIRMKFKLQKSIVSIISSFLFVSHFSNKFNFIHFESSKFVFLDLLPGVVTAGDLWRP